MKWFKKKFQWQEMNLAPKDGTYFLAHCKHSWKCHTIIKWNSRMGDWQENDGQAAAPAHWMPLPKVPARI